MRSIAMELCLSGHEVEREAPPAGQPGLLSLMLERLLGRLYSKGVTGDGGPIARHAR